MYCAPDQSFQTITEESRQQSTIQSLTSKCLWICQIGFLWAFELFLWSFNVFLELLTIVEIFECQTNCAMMSKLQKYSVHIPSSFGLSAGRWKYFQRMEGVEQRPLKYSIHACSSHSGARPPFLACVKILVSFSFLHSREYHGRPAIRSNIEVPSSPQPAYLCPITIAFRWSSDTNSPPQYLVLR